jgi:hypothetical protein
VRTTERYVRSVPVDQPCWPASHASASGEIRVPGVSAPVPLGLRRVVSWTFSAPSAAPREAAVLEDSRAWPS